MGLSLFKNCSVYPCNTQVIAPNPNPVNFIILEAKDVGNGVVISKIKYPDCTNFEGVKICVFEGTTTHQIRARDSIDPHFSAYIDSPIARFKPTAHGEELAYKFAEYLSQDAGKEEE